MKAIMSSLSEKEIVGAIIKRAYCLRKRGWKKPGEVFKW